MNEHDQSHLRAKRRNTRGEAFVNWGSTELQMLDLSTPRPQAGEVRLKVTAVGVNYADVLQRKGTYSYPVLLPFVAGYEVAGVVDTIGEGVTNL